MNKTFLPVILGTDANCYGLARSFHEEYNINSLAVGTFALRETRNSKIVEVQVYDNLYQDFVKIMTNIYEKNKDKYDKLILLSCAEWYTDLILDNREKLSKMYILPFMDKKLKPMIEDKESFYNICNKYNLDYPKTTIITKSNYKNIDIQKYDCYALKPSSSTEYSKINFTGKEKSYKLNSIKEVKEISKLIFDSGYNGNIIVQDYIPGSDDSMYVLNCYSNHLGKVKMMCLGRCIMEEHTPYGVGNYKAIISTYNEEIYKKVKEFLESINYVGYSNFDIKYDYRDKKYKFFEMNLRQGRSSFFVTACGCNLAKYLVEDYIYNLDNETVYNKNKHLWLVTPKGLLKKYLPSSIYKEVRQLIKEKKYTYTLKYNKDNSIKRIIWNNIIYGKDYKIVKKYPPVYDKKEESNNSEYQLGVLGGLGPKASSYFYELLTDNTNALTDQEHINTIILSHASIPDRTSYILDNTKENPYPKLINDVKLLELLGVKMIVIPCNTCCYFHDKLQSETSITIRNMVKDTIEHIKNKKYKKVCIMATLGTIESKLYQNELDKYNIEYVVADTTKTMDIIYNYVKANKKVDRKQFDNIINNVKADAYILGCTELSVLKKELNLEDKFIDPLEVEVSIVLKYFNKERK